jgi:hypothetical protein
MLENEKVTELKLFHLCRLPRLISNKKGDKMRDLMRVPYGCVSGFGSPVYAFM